MRKVRLACCAIVAATMLLGFETPAHAQLMIVGNDQKVKVDDGKVTMQPPGHDTLSIIDMSKPANLRIVATIPLDNTIIGPPTNLAITPKGDLALVANSVNGVEKDGKWQTEPDNRLFVVDLKANPPAVIATVHLGKRPSGMAINAAGTMALVCNRADGHDLGAVDRRQGGQGHRHGNGRRPDRLGLGGRDHPGRQDARSSSNRAVDKVAVLTIDNGKVTYDKKNDLPGQQLPLQRSGRAQRQDRPRRQYRRRRQLGWQRRYG